MYVIQIHTDPVPTGLWKAGTCHKLLEDGQKAPMPYTNTLLGFSYSFLCKGRSSQHCPLAQQVLGALRSFAPHQRSGAG